jgi:hypothetical protein
LIHLARKAGFLLYKQSKEYRIANIASALDFCRYTLSRWHEEFLLQLDENVQKLRQGAKEIHATFQANEQEGRDYTVDLSLQLANEEYVIPQNFAKKMLKSDGSPLFIDGFGAVRMAKKEIAVTCAQHDILNKFNNEIPRYMMYSIFSLSDIPYRDAPQILE